MTVPWGGVLLAQAIGERGDEGRVGLDVGIDEAEEAAVVAHGSNAIERDPVGDHLGARDVDHLDDAVGMLRRELLNQRDLLGWATIGDEPEARVALRDLAGDEKPEVREHRAGASEPFLQGRHP